MDTDVSWKFLVVRGVIGIVFGILAVVWPISTATALMVLWGVWVLADGIGALVQASRPESAGTRLGSVVLGVAALIAAFFAIFSPQVAAETLTWIVGIWLILRGLFEAIVAFSTRLPGPRWLVLLSAVLSILLGVFFVANPGRGAVGIAVLLGIIALTWGVVYVVAGLLTRRELAEAASRR
ncbi:HdeD family acid-resistance protein [Kribbella sp. CA-253562]|uniref:HdeD family acid-resistance protein n=1 Tax=Kribbella sp. CA-253562 TaxID=3239942 RepID=UPI003D8A2598